MSKTKTALITGATGNLGKVVTDLMVSNGYRIIGTTEPGRKCPADTESVQYRAIDLTNAELTRLFIQEIHEASGPIDAVVCLVGGFAMAGVTEAETDDFTRMINLNFHTAFNTVQPVLKDSKERGGAGHIILVGAKPAFDSQAAKAAFPYALSKSMVIKLAEVINADIKNHGYKASVIVPSIIDTLPNREAMPDANFSDWVTPESIAEKIAFLCGERGQDLRDTILRIYGRV